MGHSFSEHPDLEKLDSAVQYQYFGEILNVFLEMAFHPDWDMFLRFASVKKCKVWTSINIITEYHYSNLSNEFLMTFYI